MSWKFYYICFRGQVFDELIKFTPSTTRLNKITDFDTAVIPTLPLVFVWVGGDQPNAENPLGNPTFPGGTWTCGMNRVGSIVPEFNTSTTLAYNFAEGGAVTDSDLVSPCSTSVNDFDDQVDEFIEDPVGNSNWMAENTVAPRVDWC
ncbi:hypothetical protein MKZ38_001439 [Zalerion maritima]|uniref:Uncharacterized protein n=1 Tax=Zalerion maritima TaxID=339359 RepID=A0AAD5WXG7_9PEZI|nr:hypothetical protein MKZ38_001439 [Zalerion maritima]